jgi:hypothetical protein
VYYPIYALRNTTHKLYIILHTNYT